MHEQCHICLRLNNHIFSICFWTLLVSFCTIVCTKSICLNYFSFITGLLSDSISLLTLFFVTSLVLPGILHFHMNFRDCWYTHTHTHTCTHQLAGIFIGTTLNLWIIWGGGGQSLKYWVFYSMDMVYFYFTIYLGIL